MIPTRSKGKGPGDRVAADPHEVDGLTLLRLLSGDWIHVIFVFGLRLVLILALPLFVILHVILFFVLLLRFLHVFCHAIEDELNRRLASFAQLLRGARFQHGQRGVLNLDCTIGAV